jgi:CheY-like chemotaxis protein
MLVARSRDQGSAAASDQAEVVRGGAKLAPDRQHVSKLRSAAEPHRDQAIGVALLRRWYDPTGSASTPQVNEVRRPTSGACRPSATFMVDWSQRLAAVMRTEVQAERPKIVLIAEDEVIIRQVLAEHLRDCGFEVIATVNVQEAMQVLRDGLPVDVLLADVRMPGEPNGFGLARWVRQHHLQVRIVMTSGVDRAARQASDLCAAEHEVAIPHDPARIAAEIRRLSGVPGAAV